MPLTILKCSFCGKQIQGKYFYDWAGHSICSSHEHLIPMCASCDQYCLSGSKDIGMGLRICSHCQQYHIDRVNADKIVNYIKDLYSKTPIGSVTNWRLKMIDESTLFKLTHNKNTRGLAKACGSEYTIYVYQELSRVAFANVLAHEMLHVFQYTNHYYPSQDVCEGFCNLGSYIVMQSIGNSEAKARMNNLENNPDIIYGDGFRKVLGVYRQGGWPAAIRLLNLC